MEKVLPLTFDVFLQSSWIARPKSTLISVRRTRGSQRVRNTCVLGTTHVFGKRCFSETVVFKKTKKNVHKQTLIGLFETYVFVPLNR